MELLKILFIYINLIIFIKYIAANTDNNNSNSDFKIVKTENGLIRGKKEITLFHNKIYYSFKGIPYAKPPVNKLRFKAPKKLKLSKDKDSSIIYDAFDFGSVCLQPNGMFNYDKTLADWLGDENCLYLNIYTPDISDDANLAVIFFIHGGAFAEGSGDLYGPDFLINENVILVTINYRLGAFGFMSLQDENYSGNMGLKDQLMALKWINNNIKKFGGNNKLITMVGQSAGGASSHYHILSSASKGLFQRAIPMSGSTLNAWAYSPMVHHLFHMHEFAKALNVPVNNVTELIRFLKNANAVDILKFGKDIIYTPGLSRKNMPLMTWAPLAELSFVKEPFLIDKVEHILISDEFSSDVDTMFGYTSEETSFMIQREVNDPQLLKPFNEDFEVELPLRGGQPEYRKYTSKEYNISKSIRELYFGKSKNIDKDTLIEYNGMLSDLWVSYGIDLSVKMQARKSNGKTYYYTFSVDDELNFFKKYFNITLPGTSHGDELCYIFRCSIRFMDKIYENIQENSNTMKLIETMSKLWANFAKYGDPTSTDFNVVHKPIYGNTINYLNIANDGLHVGKDPRKKYIDFWNDFYTNTKHNLFTNYNVKSEL